MTNLHEKKAGFVPKADVNIFFVSGIRFA